MLEITQIYISGLKKINYTIKMMVMELKRMNYQKFSMQIFLKGSLALDYISVKKRWKGWVVRSNVFLNLVCILNL